MSQPPVRIAIAGAQGRMGRQMADAVQADARLALAARFHRPGIVGDGLVSRDEALAMADVVIDFTTPAASADLARFCADRGGPALVIGSTGFDAAELATIANAAKSIAIVRSGSFSLGLNMLIGLVEQAARALDSDDWDIEIVEAHHNRKADAPSGTALQLGAAAEHGRGSASPAERGREGAGLKRRPGAIGYASIRGGTVAGDHDVMFLGSEERLILSHRAERRTIFARGALAAARFLKGKPVGLYTMRDVIDAA